MSIDIITRCWNCGATSNRCGYGDAVDSDAIPHDGDVSICFYCGELALFDHTLEDKIRKPTPAEMDELRNNEEVLAMLMAWHVFQQHQARRRRRRKQDDDYAT